MTHVQCINLGSIPGPHNGTSHCEVSEILGYNYENRDRSIRTSGFEFHGPACTLQGCIKGRVIFPLIRKVAPGLMGIPLLFGVLVYGYKQRDPSSSLRLFLVDARLKFGICILS